MENIIVFIQMFLFSAAMFTVIVAPIVIIHKYYSKTRNKLQEKHTNPLTKNISTRHWHYVVIVTLLLQHGSPFIFKNVEKDSRLVSVAFVLFVMGVLSGAFFSLFFFSVATKGAGDVSLKRKRMFAGIYSLLLTFSTIGLVFYSY